MKLKLILILAIGLSACKKGQKTVAPEVRPIVQVVYAAGNLYPENEYKISSNVAGFVQEIMVNEGDTISVGQPLFTISAKNRTSDLDAQKYALSIAEQNANKNSAVFQQIQERINAAEIKMENDLKTLNRYNNLLKTGAVAQADVDKVENQYELSKRDYFALKSQLENQKNTTNLELNNARNRYNQAQIAIGDTRLSSILNGTVFDIKKQIGEFVNVNETIALIGDNKKMLARLSIDESDYLLIKNGQEVLITFDAFGDKIYKAKIVKLYPMLNKAEQNFKADAEFIEELPSMVYGLNLEANIVIKSVEKALTIPKNALLNNDSVRVIRNGNEVKVGISKGLSDLNFIEVTAGLTETDQIILP